MGGVVAAQGWFAPTSRDKPCGLVKRWRKEGPPLALTHELIVWSHFRREEDYACVLGLKGDARAPRKIFERDGGKLQPPTTRCAKAVDAR